MLRRGGFRGKKYTNDTSMSCHKIESRGWAGAYEGKKGTLTPLPVKGSPITPKQGVNC